MDHDDARANAALIAFGHLQPREALDAAHIERQREWSRETFGPGLRTLGVIEHIRKELDEIERDPWNVYEWVDVMILAVDGAWRAGYEPQAIIDAYLTKMERNYAREWPDWRTFTEGQAIEHVRNDLAEGLIAQGMNPDHARDYAKLATAAPPDDPARHPAQHVTLDPLTNRLRESTMDEIDALRHRATPTDE